MKWTKYKKCVRYLKVSIEGGFTVPVYVQYYVQSTSIPALRPTGRIIHTLYGLGTRISECLPRITI